jgi:hypothetical protein
MPLVCEAPEVAAGMSDVSLLLLCYCLLEAVAVNGALTDPLLLCLTAWGVCGPLPETCSRHRSAVYVTWMCVTWMLHSAPTPKL